MLEKTAAAQGEEGLRGQLERVIELSIPAILAEISSMAMQYIDAAMVGRREFCPWREL